MPPFDPTAILNTSAFGVLAYVIWFGCNRLVKHIDDQVKSNDTLSKAVAALILKHKYPAADVKDDAAEVLNEIKDRNAKP